MNYDLDQFGSIFDFIRTEKANKTKKRKKERKKERNIEKKMIRISNIANELPLFCLLNLIPLR